MKKLNIQEVKSFIEAQTPETKIYLGADSARYKYKDKWYADYMEILNQKYYEPMERSN